MSESKKRKWKRLRAILQTPYVRLPLILLAVVVAGLAVVYIFIFIFLIYALATSIGNPNAQLVVGMIGALGTVASSAVAILLYRNSVGGAEISVALEDPLYADVELRIRRSAVPPAQLQAGMSQEFFERIRFAFEVVLVNSGPKSGAMTDIELKLISPDSSIPTINEGVASEDQISMSWVMKVVTRETYRPTTLRSGRLNAVSLASNESLVLIAEVDLLLSDREIGVRPPLNGWLDIQKRTPYLQFKFQWRTASKGSLNSAERSFEVRPKFGKPIQEGPAVVIY